MADIKKWFQPEITKKAIYEGIYPVVITAAKTPHPDSTLVATPQLMDQHIVESLALKDS